MSRDSYASLAAEICATEWQREESARERAAASSMPTYDELLRRVESLEAERDEWRDAYMELRKLMNVPEC